MQCMLWPHKARLICLTFCLPQSSAASILTVGISFINDAGSTCSQISPKIPRFLALLVLVLVFVQEERQNEREGEQDEKKRRARKDTNKGQGENETRILIATLLDCSIEC